MRFTLFCEHRDYSDITVLHPMEINYHDNNIDIDINDSGYYRYRIDLKICPKKGSKQTDKQTDPQL